MEYFFLDDRFCTDLSDLMDQYDLDEDNVNDLPDDWKVEVMPGQLEKMFTLKMETVVDRLTDYAETWHEERFPEDSDRQWEQIKKAVQESVDIEKLNALLPSLYYPADKSATITKADLIEWCK